jgi:SAM-dependent methyltransferase
MCALDAADHAQHAYDALAGSYDDLTLDYDHERWLAAIERLARAHGLRGRRVLDVACGTGKSFLPLLERGYEVTGCDISPAMLGRAAAKAPGVRLVAADMRRLGRLGRFDLVTCLDDALNYLLDERDLRAALAGMRANLAPGGLLVFDVNTLLMYRTAFAADRVVEGERVLLAWRGSAAAPGPGGLVEVAVHAFTPGDRGWRRSSSVHRQRHWPLATLRRVATAAGLRVVAVRGQRPGAVLDDVLDEDLRTKLLVVAQASDARGGAGR